MKQPHWIIFSLEILVINNQMYNCLQKVNLDSIDDDGKHIYNHNYFNSEENAEAFLNNNKENLPSLDFIIQKIY